jgi:hypothetical protein
MAALVEVVVDESPLSAMSDTGRHRPFGGIGRLSKRRWVWPASRRALPDLNLRAGARTSPALALAAEDFRVHGEVPSGDDRSCDRATLTTTSWASAPASDRHFRIAIGKQNCEALAAS